MIPKNTIKFILSTVYSFFPKDDIRVVLFGPYARQSADKYSDIDIAILSETKLDESNWQKLQLAFEESYLPSAVVVVNFQEAEEDFKKVIMNEAVYLS